MTPACRTAHVHRRHLGSTVNRGLEARGLRDDVDLIVTADHGMTSLDRSRTIYLGDYIDVSTVDVVTWYPVLGLIPKAPATTTQVVAQLQGKHPQLQVWAKVRPSCAATTPGSGCSARLRPALRRSLTLVGGSWCAPTQEDVPERFHYGHNRRVTPVVALAAKGWAIEECVVSRAVDSGTLPRGVDSPLMLCATLGRSRASTAWFGAGMHGYDNEEADMHAIFLAR